MTLGARPRLPAHRAARGPARRHLPLADAARDIDRALRPSTPCGRSRSPATWRAATAARAPARARPDELTTAEALDLVDRWRASASRRSRSSAGEAYLRDDWLDLVRAIRGARDAVHHDLGSARPHRRGHRTRAKAAGLRGASISIDGAEPTHDRLRGLRQLRRGHRRAARAQGRRHARLVQHADQPALAADPRAVLETARRRRDPRMADPAHRPDGARRRRARLLLQPYDLLELFPRLAALKKRCDAPGSCSGRATTSATSGPYESLLRGALSEGHWRLVRRGAGDAGHRGQRRHQGLPVAADRALDGAATSATIRSRTSGSAASRCASRAIARWTISGGTAGPATTPRTA